MILPALITVPALLLAPEEPASGRSPLTRPPAIAADGVPEIPTEVSGKLRRYQEIRSASFVDWHPGGGMIVASRLDRIHQLYRVREASARLEPLTEGDEPVQTGVALDDGQVLFPRGTGGDENFQLLRSLPDGGTALLTDGRSRHLLGPLDPPRQRVAFTSNARNGRDEDVYALSLAAGARPELLIEAKGQKWNLVDWSPDGQKALINRYVSANESYPYLLDIARRELEPLPPELGAATPRKVRRGSLRFGSNAVDILVTSDARGEHLELARLDARSNTYEWLTADIPWDVEEVEVSRDRRFAVFAVNEAGLSSLHLIDLTTRQRRALRLPAGVVSDLRLSADGTRLGLTLATAVEPAEAFAYSLADDRLQRWTLSERSGFTAADFVTHESFAYPSFDGRQIPALVFRPRAGGRVPVIVSIHGGPEGQSRPGFVPIRQYFVRELGAAVILPNVRGSTGYGKTYTMLDNGKLREDSVRDIGALLDWIARDERLDADRVAVMGGSYGGYMTLASLIHFGRRLRAGVDVVGITSFETFLKNTSAYRRDLRRAEYGDERDPEMREHFARISPAGRIGELRSALLVVHGANDPRVPITEAQQIVARARETGQPVWTLYAGNEGHGFQRRENIDYEQAVTSLFLRRFLIDVPPTPQPTDGPGWHDLGYTLFQQGRFAESLNAFEASVRLGGRTHDADECWERGLARYYTGDYQGGRKQFESYHRVGALDIENGLWIFICEAERSGIEKARTLLPEYRDRRRPPFPALLELYLGKGTAEAVIAEAQAQPAGARRDEALFYAHLYTGKYLQATGAKAAAREQFAAALRHPVRHFMQWCAESEARRTD